MSTFTPGPWEIITELRSTDEIVCDMLNSGYVAITKGQKLANWRDDANLIAAAPDLYASAWEALGVLTGIRDDAMSRNNREAMVDEAIASIEKSIAKARGES